MEIECLNSNFRMIYILDKFNSLIWTDRYWSSGDFDIKIPPNIEVLNELLNVKYLRLSESEHLMILEDLNIHSDIENGDSLILTGRSLESILDRRIVWTGTSMSGNFQTEIEDLLKESIINPTDTDRAIDNFEFIASTDPAITGLTVDSQFVGDLIYDVITTLCRNKDVGFKVTLNQYLNFQFLLYKGVNRSYSQSTNPYIVFSPNNDNLINSDYVETSRFVKTIMLVAGEEGVGNARITTSVAAPGGSLTGLNRKEAYYQPNITRNSPDGQLTDPQYIAKLQERGAAELSKNKFVKVFDGEVDFTMYNFGEDFFMGDVLQIEDAYGHQTETRVVEVIYSQDKEGIRTYPTFATVE